MKRRDQASPREASEIEMQRWLQQVDLDDDSVGELEAYIASDIDALEVDEEED